MENNVTARIGIGKLIRKVGEPLMSREIEREKEWIARSIALGFKKYNATPKEGSEIVYTVTEREDGILIEGYQETADLPLFVEKQISTP